MDFHFRPVDLDVDLERLLYIQYTLTTLFHYLRNIEQVDFDGLLVQEIFDQITRLPKCSLHTLRLRKSLPLVSCLDINRVGSHMRVINLKDLCIRWNSLGQLDSLRVLEIQQLLPREGAGLALAVRKLRLERLLVCATNETERYLVDPDDEDPNVNDIRWSPLNSFFREIFPIGGSCGLSKSLKSLVLVDTHASYVK